MQMIILLIFLIILILWLLFTIHSFYLGCFVYKIGSPGKSKTNNNERNLRRLQGKDENTPFKFIVLGDVQSRFKNLHELACLNGEKSISFVIQTGDLVSHADEGHYSLLLHELDKYSALSFLVVPGNHDIKGGKFLYDNYFGLKQYYFFFHRCLFIGMDNSFVPPYKVQFQWLKETLNENYLKAKHTFIFMHREPIEWERGEPHPVLDDYTPFFQLLKNFQVDYVFSGHLHDYQRLELNGTVFISNGLTNKRSGFIKINPSYITLIEVNADRVQDTRIPVYQSLTTRFSGWYLDTSVAHFYPWLKKLPNSLFRLKD